MNPDRNPPTPTTSPRGGRLTRVLLLAAWVTLTLGATGFVATYGANMPYADEWQFVPVLTGHAPAGTWLWAQHNEHRMPLPRAIYLALFRATHDFRAGMFLQVGIISALAFGLILLATRLRGRAHWADAFFPISLLHFGHWENFLMGYQLSFALFTVLVTGIGVVALRARTESAFRSGVLAGVFALSLSLCGGFGIVVALPVCLWVTYLAVLGRRTEPRGSIAGLFVLAGLPLLYVGWYRMGYELPQQHPGPWLGGARVIAITTGETLAMAFGIGSQFVWPWVCGSLLLFGVATVAVLARDPNRASSLGLLALTAGVAGLALAIGVGRSGFTDESGHFREDMGLWSRYSFFTWPLLGLAYLVWVKQGTRWLPTLLCIAATILFPANLLIGQRHGEWLRGLHAGIADDARKGVPAIGIVSRNLVGSGQEERAVRAIRMLREAKIGAFAGK